MNASVIPIVPVVEPKGLEGDATIRVPAALEGDGVGCHSGNPLPLGFPVLMKFAK